MDAPTLKEALRVLQGVILAADNTIAIGNLKACPFEAKIIPMEPFNVYSNLKKKIRKLQVFLHRNYVIFSQAEYSEATETTSHQYIESIQTAGVQLVETYKGCWDTFAIFHGSLSSGSKLFVLQPLLRDVVLKQIWTQRCIEACKVAPMVTVGTHNPPLGNTRLQVVRLFSALLQCINTRVAGEIVRLKTFTVLMDLFFEYPWNIFLHTQVECCVNAVLTSSVVLNGGKEGEGGEGGGGGEGDGREGDGEGQKDSNSPVSLRHHVS